MLMYLVLGCLMDAMAMIILTVPIIFPVITALGFDPVWFGVIIVMTVELGLIHPPVGMNVFVIKTVVKDVSFSTIFLGVIPFVLTDILRLVILIAFPAIATMAAGTDVADLRRVGCVSRPHHAVTTGIQPRIRLHACIAEDRVHISSAFAT